MYCDAARVADLAMIRFHRKLKIKDIHTHKLPEVPGEALICIGCGPLPVRQGDFFSAGLHPWDVTGSDEESFRNLEQLLALPQVLAVGECGFDTLKGPAHDLQEQAFVRQAELSERFRKPMILHVVRDFDSIIRLHKQLRPQQQWLVHGFRGGPEQMTQLYNNGILVSFGIKCNPESLKQIPSTRLFVETDGAFSISDVIKFAADVRETDFEEIENIVVENHRRFLLSKAVV